VPEELKEALARVAATLPPVDWLPPDRLRAKARAARRRTAALLVVVLAVAGFGVGRSLLPHPAPALACPDGQTPAHLRLVPTKDIKVLVSGADRDATSTARDELRLRGFVIFDTGSADSAPADSGIALIRYGPAAVGAAWVVRAYLRDEAQYSYEPDRTSPTVDLALGPAFQSIATATDANRYLASIGHPPPPPGTCGVD
jgi:hypothetical protein